MSDSAFDMAEFIKPKTVPQPPADVQEEEVEETIEEIDIQRAVVEELAADKVELHERIANKDEELAEKKKEIAALSDALKEKDAQIAELRKELEAAKADGSRLKADLSRLDAALNEKLLKELDQQERNPNALALLDRDVELPDRFPGETRDHVLEVIKEARDKAEAEGRIRRAQLLEGVLVANEPNGGLAKKRVALEKFFRENGNIVNGVVIAELERCGISYKNGEDYLLPKEILTRTY